MMTRSEAEQIAALLNERNQLVHQYTGQEVLDTADTYQYEIRDGRVIACVERKRV
jgi:hypothetical protein